MIYVWDEHKNDLNVKKHGISFEEASTVFERPIQLCLMILTIQKMRKDFL